MADYDFSASQAAARMAEAQPFNRCWCRSTLTPFVWSARSFSSVLLYDSAAGRDSHLIRCYRNLAHCR